jgi:CRP/FNR family transcriptional regulator, cyclic AMP receptor protein
MDRHAWIDERLAEVPLFSKLSKKQLREVSSLATRLDFPAGKELTHQGGIGNEFIIVLEGEVEVQIDGEVIATRGPGEYFGEIALLEDRPRTATVVAKTAVACEVIGRREFATLVNDVPEIAQQLQTTMAERLQEDEDFKKK